MLLWQVSQSEGRVQCITSCRIRQTCKAVCGGYVIASIKVIMQSTAVSQRQTDRQAEKQGVDVERTPTRTHKNVRGTQTGRGNVWLIITSSMLSMTAGLSRQPPYARAKTHTHPYVCFFSPPPPILKTFTRLRGLPADAPHRASPSSCSLFQGVLRLGESQVPMQACLF